MTATYDLSTNVGKTRLYSKDTSTVSPRFTDEEINAFLAIENGNPRLAAAVSLELTAANTALMAKVAAVGEIKFVDMAAMSESLISQAKNLRRLVQVSGATRSPLTGIKRTESYLDI
jgi:hypothetical protein